MTVFDYSNSNPAAVRLTDTNGDYVAVSGGTQYTNGGVPPANPVGNALVYDNGGAWASVSTTNAFPVQIIGTPTVVTGGLTDAQLRATPVPISGTVAFSNTTIAVTNTGTFAVQAAQAGTWNITDISGTVSLPTGASTAALQTTGNTSLATLAGAVSGTEMQVDVLTMPTVTVQATNLDIRDLANATDSVAIYGSDDGGTTNRIIKTDATGAVQIDVESIGTVTITGTVTANAGTNLNTSALALESGGNLASIKTNTDKIPSLGQALAAASVPVVLTAAQITTLTPQTDALTDTQLRATAVPVSLTSTTITGTVAATQSGTWNINNVSGTISLPTGAATSALQTTGNTSLSSIDSKTPALGQALAAASVPVVLTASQLSTLTPLSTVAVTQSTSPWIVSNGGTFAVQAAQSGTWNITNISGTVSLPTGASTLAEQQTQTTSLQLLDDTVYTDGVGTVTKGIAILGQDGTNPQAIKTDANGELQVDVLTMPTVTVTATNLDIRDLTSSSDSVSIVEQKSATGTQSNVAGSATSVTLLSSNANRLGASIVNDSAAILYVKMGTTASATDYAVRMYPNDYFEVPFNYTGRIDGIWASATGSARVTEYT